MQEAATLQALESDGGLRSQGTLQGDRRIQLQLPDSGGPADVRGDSSCGEPDRAAPVRQYVHR